MTRKATPGSILDDLMSAAPAGAVKPAASPLRIADIRRDGGTQPRAGLDETHVADLVAALANGDELPPVDVIFDGSAYWLYDGFHRVEATSRSGKYTVQAIIHQGTQQDAQWASYAANSRHGLKRTNDDKRRQVIAALKHPAGASMSNRELARHVGVDEGTVRNYREQMTVSAEIPQIAERTVSRGGQTYTQNTAGQREAAQRRQQRDDAAEDTWTAQQQTPTAPPKWAAIWELEGHVRDCAKQFYADETPAHAAQDMRAAAMVRDGGFWNRCQRTPASIVAWRPNDLVQAINNVASQMAQQPPVGKPMIEVLKTADELAAEAEAADIASREAAADEAERQATEAARQAEREAAAIAATDAAFGVTRHTHLLHVLEQAIEALPEIGDAIGQRQFCLSVVVTLETMQKELRRKMAEATVAPAPAAPATELPADLVAHGWELRRTRDGGRWIAAITPPDEEREITTVKRSSVADVIGDCRYMERTLRIGAPA